MGDFVTEETVCDFCTCAPAAVEIPVRPGDPIAWPEDWAEGMDVDEQAVLQDRWRACTRCARIARTAAHRPRALAASVCRRNPTAKAAAPLARQLAKEGLAVLYAQVLPRLDHELAKGVEA